MLWKNSEIVVAKMAAPIPGTTTKGFNGASVFRAIVSVPDIADFVVAGFESLAESGNRNSIKVSQKFRLFAASARQVILSCLPRRGLAPSTIALMKVDTWLREAAFEIDGMQLCSPMITLAFDRTDGRIHGGRDFVPPSAHAAIAQEVMTVSIRTNRA